MSETKRERHPLNAEGDFYVENGMCICCDAAPSEAPDLLIYDENTHCYFKRQPQTVEEIRQAINACKVSELCAVRYAGNDKKTLSELSPDECDIYD